MGSCLSSAVKTRKMRAYKALYENKKLPESVRKAVYERMLNSELPAWERWERSMNLKVTRSTTDIANKRNEQRELVLIEKMTIDNIKRTNPTQWNRLVMMRVDGEWKDMFLPTYKKLDAEIKAELVRKSIAEKKLENAREKVNNLRQALSSIEGEDGMPSEETSEMLFSILNEDFEPITATTITHEPGPEQNKFATAVNKSTELAPLMKKENNNDDALIDKLMEMMGVTGGSNSSADIDIVIDGTERRGNSSSSSGNNNNMVMNDNY